MTHTALLFDRLRRTCADAVLLFLLPAFIALLPWRIGFALCKRAAHCAKLYRPAVDPAWAAAREHFPDADEAAWKYRQRLLRLLDHVDSYLTLLRGARWWRRQIDVHGTWPATAPGTIFLTYHWGAGHWIWRELRAHGFDAGFVARRAQGRALGATRLSHAYGRFRAWALPRIGSRGPLFVGAGKDALIDELRAGASIVGMLDLPAPAPQRSIELPLLDGTVRFPTGLAHLAIEQHCPVTLFSAAFDIATGRRQLWIQALPADSVEEIMRRYAAHLDERLRAQPEFWQIWREAPAMFIARGTQAL